MADSLEQSVENWPCLILTRRHGNFFVGPEDELELHSINIYLVHQQSVGSTGNGISLSDLIGFTPQFESQENLLCWENLCLPVRAETFNLNCGTGLKVPPTVGILLKKPRG